MRLAHFSDIHVTLSPLAQGSFGAAKRVVGSLNYYLGGRRRHFHDVERRIALLLEDIDRQGVDHALCTGDLTAMSYGEEFERCAALFGLRREDPARCTVIPGNHDRYVPEGATGGERRFERWFGAVSEGGRYPFIKRLPGGVAIVGLDVSRPTALLDSSGRCGPEQLEKLRAILRDPGPEVRFVILALHYGLLRDRGQPDRPTHGIEDYLDLLAVIDAPDSRLDLVLHGHIHKPYAVPGRSDGGRAPEPGRCAIRCAGSATDLHQRRCGYDLYQIDAEARRFSVERRVWDEARGMYSGEAAADR
jgi:3',5'-cyclic AMP phosphodiesterase CpdA